MTSTDYIIDISLIAIVLLQIRGRKLSLHSLLLPVGIVSYVGYKYLHGVPTSGNSFVLVVLAAAAGTTLGVLAGWFTSVKRSPEGNLIAKAGPAAAALWILGTGGRLAFQLYATHGGGSAIAHFSAAQHIDSSEAWVSALILMALGEALARTAVLGVRAYRLAPAHFASQRAMIDASDRAF